MDHASQPSAWSYLRAYSGILLGGLTAFISFQFSKGLMAGECEAQQQTAVWPFAAMVMLNLTGGFLSWRAMREGDPMSGRALAAKLGVDFSAFIGALLLMHLVYVKSFLTC